MARHGWARRGDLAGAVRCQLGEWLARRVFRLLVAVLFAGPSFGN